MKNLKKVLALVTVVAVLLTCVPAVFASDYSDVSDNASYAEAVEMLSKLGIFAGYEDGTFQPDKNITRAEAAAVITRFLAQEETAKTMAGATIFTDMGEAQWATGYVNFGVQKGYIQGMGDGTFRPNDPVTYEQIVKMIVAALGYTLKAEDLGGYPSGYLSVASQEEITKGTSGANGAAPRSTVARLLYNALDVSKMQVDKYISNGDKEYTEYGKTVLKEDHKVDKYVAIVGNTSMVNMQDTKEDPTVDLYYTEKNGTKSIDNTVIGTANRIRVGESNALKYLGYMVTAYVREDEVTGKDTIIAITPKTNKNDVLTVSAANIDKYERNTVFYWKNKDADKKATEIELNDPTVITNNNSGSPSDLNGEINGVVTFISYDGNTNNGYEFVIISSYDAEFVIDEIDAENYTISAIQESITGVSAGVYNVDPEDDDAVYTYIKDGKTVSFEDLEEGDTVSVIADRDEKNIVFYVSSAKATGAVTKASSTTPVKYTIDGTAYEAKDGVEIAVADEGTFYVNVDGIIVYADTTSDAEGNYGYFIAADSKPSFGKDYWSIEFVDENGNDVKATLAARVKVGTGVVESKSKKQEDIDLTKLFKDGPQLFKYDTNSSGDITKIILADPNADKTGKKFSLAGDYAEDEVTYSAKTGRAGKFEFDDTTVVFSVKEKFEDADDVTVSTVKALFEDGEFAPAFKAYDMATNSKVVGAIVVTGASDNVDESAHVVIVTSVSNVKFGEEKGYVIEGIQNGQAVSFNVCEEEEALNETSADPEDLQKGDVIMVAEGVDYVTNIELKAQVAAQTPQKGDPYDVSKSRKARDIRNYVTARTNNDLTLANGEEINVSGARFTLVGTTGANTIVKASSVGAISLIKGKSYNSKDFSYFVYLRVYDDDVVDVVIYEVNKVDIETTPEEELVEEPEVE